MVGNSVCSDDINAMQFPTTGGLLGPFNLGGLDGFPFTGLTGIQAFAHHVPEEPKPGALLIYFGPHIGITEKGDIGKVLRTGQEHASNCCGAAQAALKRINDNPAEPTVLDYQQDTIVRLAQNNKQRIRAATYPIQELTQVMFEAIEARIRLLIKESIKDFLGKFTIIIGSVLINVDDGEGEKPYVALKVFEIIRTSPDATTEATDHLKGFIDHLKKKGMH